MKKSIIITVIIALFSMGKSGAQETKNDKFTVEINGMGCPYCASGIDNEFSKLDGISNIKIDIKTGTLTFTYPAEANLSLKKVKAKVSKAGYTPRSAKVERANGKVEVSSSKNEAGTTQIPATIEGKTFLVAGECEMCKERIETAAKGVSGVTKASWNVKTDMLRVTFDSEKTSAKTIKKAVADVGHDTKTFRATDKAYNNLHACCKYERLK